MPFLHVLPRPSDMAPQVLRHAGCHSEHRDFQSVSAPGHHVLCRLTQGHNWVSGSGSPYIENSRDIPWSEGRRLVHHRTQQANRPSTSERNICLRRSSVRGDVKMFSFMMFLHVLPELRQYFRSLVPAQRPAADQAPDRYSLAYVFGTAHHRAVSFHVARAPVVGELHP